MGSERVASYLGEIADEATCHPGQRVGNADDGYKEGALLLGEAHIVSVRGQVRERHVET